MSAYKAILSAIFDEIIWFSPETLVKSSQSLKCLQSNNLRSIQTNFVKRKTIFKSLSFDYIKKQFAVHFSLNLFFFFLIFSHIFCFVFCSSYNNWWLTQRCNKMRMMLIVCGSIVRRNCSLLVAVHCSLKPNKSSNLMSSVLAARKVAVHCSYIK